MKICAFLLSIAISFVYAEEKSLYQVASEGKDSVIVKSLLSGKNSTDIVSNTRTKKIVVDTKNDRIFWIEGSGKKVLKSAKNDGSEVTEIIKLDNNARSLAFDGKHLYWVTDNNLQTVVVRSDLQGNNQETVISGKDITCITIDIEKEKLFWVTDNGVSQRVRFSDLSGKITTTILRKNSGPFSCLAIDGKNERIYWVKSVDGIETSICSSNFQGQGTQEIVKSSFITALTVTDTKVFWIGRNAGGSAVLCANTDGTEIETIFVSDRTLNDIVVK